MKRSWSVVLILLSSMGIIAATKSLPREVRDLIERALRGERQAIARYDAFALKADAEGFRGAAALFRAQAQAERTHAQRFTSLLHENEVPIPAEEPFVPNVGSTRENLNATVASERGESDTDYHTAVELCDEKGRRDIAEVFDETRDSEVEHSNLCATALRDLESLKNAKVFYVCAKCGYTTDVSLPFCPACQNKRALAAVK